MARFVVGAALGEFEGFIAEAALGGWGERGEVIAAFLRAARLGLFDLSWNVLCPGCGGVLDANATLKTIHAKSMIAPSVRPATNPRSTRWSR